MLEVMKRQVLPSITFLPFIRVLALCKMGTLVVMNGQLKR